MADGELVTFALKSIVYDSNEEKAIINAELADLNEVVAGPHHRTCTGVFDELCPVQCEEYAWVALE